MPGPAIQLAKLFLGFFEDFALFEGKFFACPVDVEVEHGHCGPKRRTLAPVAGIRRPFERACNLPRIIPRKHALFNIQRVTGFGNLLRPKFGLVFDHHTLSDCHKLS